MEIRRRKFLKQFNIPKSKYFIIDCDVGGDDALCILLAAHILKKYDKVLLGITCVAGNTTLPNVVKNALISCKIAGIKVPIFKGAQRNILGNQIVQNADNFFHEDGLSGHQLKYIQILKKQDYEMVSQQRACDFIIECAKKYKDQIGIISIGTMTNLAVAYLLDNSIVNYINCVSGMGGTFSNLGRREHFAADFNFHLDPQASEIVLDKYKNVVLTTIQFPESYRIMDKTSVFSKISETQKRQYIFDLYEKIKEPTLCDPLTLFPLLLPQEAQVQVYYAPCKVILSGKRTRGSLSIGWLDRTEGNKNIMMVCELNKIFVNKLTTEALDS